MLNFETFLNTFNLISHPKTFLNIFNLISYPKFLKSTYHYNHVHIYHIKELWCENKPLTSSNWFCDKSSLSRSFKFSNASCSKDIKRFLFKCNSCKLATSTNVPSPKRLISLSPVEYNKVYCVLNVWNLKYIAKVGMFVYFFIPLGCDKRLFIIHKTRSQLRGRGLSKCLLYTITLV